MVAPTEARRFVHSLDERLDQLTAALLVCLGPQRSPTAAASAAEQCEALSKDVRWYRKECEGDPVPRVNAHTIVCAVLPVWNRLPPIESIQESAPAPSNGIATTPPLTPSSQPPPCKTARLEGPSTFPSAPPPPSLRFTAANVRAILTELFLTQLNLYSSRQSTKEQSLLLDDQQSLNAVNMCLHTSRDFALLAQTSGSHHFVQLDEQCLHWHAIATEILDLLSTKKFNFPSPVFGVGANNLSGIIAQHGRHSAKARMRQVHLDVVTSSVTFQRFERSCDEALSLRARHFRAMLPSLLAASTAGAEGNSLYSAAVAELEANLQREFDYYWLRGDVTKSLVLAADLRGAIGTCNRIIGSPLVPSLIGLIAQIVLSAVLEVAAAVSGPRAAQCTIENCDMCPKVQAGGGSGHSTQALRDAVAADVVVSRVTAAWAQIQLGHFQQAIDLLLPITDALSSPASQSDKLAGHKSNAVSMQLDAILKDVGRYDQFTNDEQCQQLLFRTMQLFVHYARFSSSESGSRFAKLQVCISTFSQLHARMLVLLRDELTRSPLPTDDAASLQHIVIKMLLESRAPANIDEVLCRIEDFVVHCANLGTSSMKSLSREYFIMLWRMGATCATSEEEEGAHLDVRARCLRGALSLRQYGSAEEGATVCRVMGKLQLQRHKCRQVATDTSAIDAALHFAQEAVRQCSVSPHNVLLLHECYVAAGNEAMAQSSLVQLSKCQPQEVVLECLRYLACQASLPRGAAASVIEEYVRCLSSTLQCQPTDVQLTPPTQCMELLKAYVISTVDPGQQTATCPTGLVIPYPKLVALFETANRLFHSNAWLSLRNSLTNADVEWWFKTLVWCGNANTMALASEGMFDEANGTEIAKISMCILNIAVGVRDSFQEVVERAALPLALTLHCSMINQFLSLLVRSIPQLAVCAAEPPTEESPFAIVSLERMLALTSTAKSLLYRTGHCAPSGRDIVTILTGEISLELCALANMQATSGAFDASHLEKLMVEFTSVSDVSKVDCSALCHIAKWCLGTIARSHPSTPCDAECDHSLEQLGHVIRLVHDVHQRLVQLRLCCELRRAASTTLSPSDSLGALHRAFVSGTNHEAKLKSMMLWLGSLGALSVTDTAAADDSIIHFLSYTCIVKKGDALGRVAADSLALLACTSLASPVALATNSEDILRSIVITLRTGNDDEQRAVEALVVEFWSYACYFHNLHDGQYTSQYKFWFQCAQRFVLVLPEEALVRIAIEKQFLHHSSPGNALSD